MMRQDHQQKIGVAQHQKLSQSARLLVQVVVASPAEFADLVELRLGENPFLSFSRTLSRGSDLRTDIPSYQPSLFAHVLAEVPMLVRRPTDLPIAIRLAEALDERGYLVDSLSGIAAHLKVPLAQVEAVLSQVQRIEPVGLFARSATECLALQLRAQGQLDEVAVRLLCNLDQIAGCGAKDFAARHGLDPDRLKQLMGLISKLPRDPAAAFGEQAATALPELHFEQRAGEWSVRPVLQSAPHLNLRHAAFAQAWQSAADAETRTELRRKWREACALHQAAGLRDATLLKLGDQLLQLQRTGLESKLARLSPLTQREMAARLSLHESTVSRMVRNRYALVEGKIVSLSQFFERPLATKDDTGLTRSIVLGALRDLLASDPGAANLSDLALTRRLAVSGIEVTRRRLGKYRKLVGIPSARKCRVTFAT